MKLKQTFLLAVAAVLSVFCTGRVYAASAFDSHLDGNVRVLEITKRVSKNAAAAAGERALSPGDTVYFDVKLVDTATGFTFISNQFDKSVTSAQDRPYLELAIPLRAQSTKNGLADTDLATGEARTVETNSAVAYYIGQGSEPAVLRFAYEVRPGDMTSLLTWSVDGTTGNPIFGGTLAAIRVAGTLSPTPGTQTAGITANTLVPQDPNALAQENVTRPWSVSGYLFTIGASYQDGGLVANDQDLNYNALYQGLVPVMVSTQNGAAAATFTNSDLAAECSFWVEAKSAGVWKYAPVGVTKLEPDSVKLVNGAYNGALSDAFLDTYAAAFRGPQSTTATTFATQTYFLNVPVSDQFPVGTEMRLCYGVRRDGGSSTLFASRVLKLKASPIISTGSSTYDVASYEVSNEDFELPAADALADGFTALAGQTVSGGTITIAAGDPAVSLTIAKEGLNNYGTVYASIERISKADGASCTPNRYYIPLDPLATTDYTLTLSVKENATGGESYFRICVPQLDAATSTAVETPYYLKVTSTKKRAKISLTTAVDGAIGSEYQLDTTGTGAVTTAESVIKYTLSVEKTEPARRYFRIYPVTSDGNPIPEDAVFVDSTTDNTLNTRKVYDVIKEYVSLSTSSGETPAANAAWLKVELPSNAASVDFYAYCLNDFPKSLLANKTIQWTKLVGGVPTPVTATMPAAGARFAAASCSSSGAFNNEVNGIPADVCEILAQPNVRNRAPILAGTPPTNGSTGTAMTFSFNAVDATSDYLVVKMVYGDGAFDCFLYADEAKMTALMGAAAWAAKISALETQFGVGTGTFKVRPVGAADTDTTGKNRKERSSDGTEMLSFTHTYESMTNPGWNVTVYDSSSAVASLSGQLNLTSAQNFMFYTVKTATRPGTGYIRWANQAETAPTTDNTFGWTFYPTYTSNGLPRGSNTTVQVKAVPFAAGDATPAGYTGVSATRDSFFYKWSTRNTDYEALLPSDPASLYETTLAFNRAFVSGGGQATDSTQWQDIILEAIFVAEYLPGDAKGIFTAEPPVPYLYAFGDYNSDGVPDGWILRNVGADDAGRALVEGASQANGMAVEDYLPYAGFANGDNAYRFGASDGRLSYGGSGGPTMQAPGCTPFGYKLRVRGRDEALNAASGMGTWLSNPAWMVLMHPEKKIDNDWHVIPVKNDGNVQWKQVRLNTSGRGATGEGVTVAIPVAHTYANRVPYLRGAEDGDGWAPVIDADGYPVKPDPTFAYHKVEDDDNYPYHAGTIEVQTREDDENYERFRYTYTAWAWEPSADGPAEVASAGAYFPFKRVDESQAVLDASTKINELKGGLYRNKYYFIDYRAVAGMLIDEPFYTDGNHLTNGALDPRWTSWLDRFSNVNSKDQDYDGISNGAEYFFWYYASRIAWGSVFAADGHVQLNTALWPAIDLRDRVVDAQNNPYAANTDEAFGTTEQFTLGRRYRNSYNPDASDKAYYTVDTSGEGKILVHEKASFGKGNYWETIPVADVLAAFNPYSGNGGKDTDNDGLLDVEEFAAGTNPIDCDTDDDWMPDGWEVRYGLNPLNISGGSVVNDAEGNPDNDYFARAIVRTYPTYHHLFKVRVPTSIGGGTGASPFPIVSSDVDYYYDYESKVFRAISDSVADDPTRLDDEHLGSWTLPWEEGKAYVTGWVDEPVRFCEFKGTLKIIRDQEVYQAFGFHPGTAWGVHALGHEALGSKLDAFKIVNTLPFTNREEFASGVRRGDPMSQSTNPKSADTNEDGVPDGWEAYVGLRPYVVPNSLPDGDQDQDVDGLTARQEFQSRATHIFGERNHWPASLQSETIYDTTWVNKVLPCDPWNPDTDFDGLWDKDEQGPVASTYSSATYTLTYSPTDRSTIGGGCDPCNIDTDGDGMPDGWEYRYCLISNSNAATDATEGEVGETDTTTVTTTTATLRGPDPTDPRDYDMDYDRDGLTQYQEYHTGLLRHLRYDLNTDAARLYKDKPGLLGQTAEGIYYWKVLPDVYNIFEDLANPAPVPSVDYVESYSFDGSVVASDAIFGTPEAFTVDPLVQAYAMTALSLKAKIDSTTMLQTDLCAPAISAAVSRGLMSSIIFPTEKQVLDYALDKSLLLNDPTRDPAIDAAAANAKAAIERLQSYIKALDAAYYRLLATKAGETPIVNGYKGDHLFSQEADAERDEATLCALVARIDGLLEVLQRYAANDSLVMQPVFRELLMAGGETGRLWDARKKQIFKALFGDGTVTAPVDPAYAAMTALTADLTGDAKFTLQDGNAPDLAGAEFSDYEAALASTTCPLLKISYRAALRGYTGGVREKELWGPFDETGTQQDSYLAPLGLHYPFRPLEQRQEAFEGLRVTRFLGLPLTYSTFIGAHAVRFDGDTDAYVTTSPLTPDTDVDGMDDYWEVFHGLNPVLGDYSSSASSNGDNSDRAAYNRNKVASVYVPQSVSGGALDNTVFAGVRPSGANNPFGAPALESGRTTGFDYYTYPWFAGVPFADPDGDGLTNAEEAVNPVASDPAHYGTDPSPLWMTDPDNSNSYTSRFYGRLNHNTLALSGLVYTIEVDPDPAPAPTPGGDDTEVTFEDMDIEDAMPARPFFYYIPENLADSFPGMAHFLPYEINEGYDTDGDGVPDMVELTSNTVYRGDPQSLRTPDIQQSAYLGGKGVLQSFVTTQFGPMALTTFTLECWVKPEADQPGANASGEVILIDRPWRFTESASTLGDLRHNFRLGLKVTTGGFLPFVNYTGTGTTFVDDGSAPKVSPTALSGDVIKPGVWTHLAATFDGSRLKLIINGVDNTAVASALIPANGVISLKNDGWDEVQRFSYRNAPVIIGAEPASAWFSTLGNPEDPKTFEDYYTGSYTGFIDEVRIWNGARTTNQIADKRSAVFTLAELLNFRTNVFTQRYEGNGYYEPNTPAQPLAIYTFNDLLGGSRIPPNEALGTPAASDTKPWERYPGEQLVGDETKIGSMTYRRKGLKETLQRLANGDVPRMTEADYPTVEELYTSYYTLTAPKNLRSTFYCENSEAAQAGTEVPQSEFVPLAHNMISHLPLADVRRRSIYNYRNYNTVNGSPALEFPSGSAENLKAPDSVYWTPYAAGDAVNKEITYNVKATGNPYAYRHLGVQTFDVDRYTVLPAFSTTYPGDLLVYGDVFAKYDFESWDSAPTTDPSAIAGGTEAPEGENWFKRLPGDTGTSVTDNQFSNGAGWLRDYVAVGQTKDTDGDRMPNWWENYYGLDPEDPTGSNGPHGDDDGDFLTNYAEYLAKSNPGQYSTAGNGVPDFHIPQWFRRGNPTFGLLYTDNDFMEDHWEAANRSSGLNVDTYDAQGDADGDGWSNWAEARANFRSGIHSTNPNVATSISQTGATILEMPTPVLRLTVDYFGDQGVYRNAGEAAQMVVHGYTAKGNNSAPDVTYTLPLSTSASAESGSMTFTHELGNWRRTPISGYFHGGNILPGSLKIRYRRELAISDPILVENTFNGSDIRTVYFDIISDTTMDGDVGELYFNASRYAWDSETGEYTVTNGERVKVGTINYRTGEFTLDFSDESVWTDKVSSFYFVDGEFTADGWYKTSSYNRSEFLGEAEYKLGIEPGRSNTFTLAYPTTGHLREGLNNFFVFADLNGNGEWNDGEPAGVPDQHDVDIGFDQVNKPLHVALSERAPMGAVRFDASTYVSALLSDGASETTGLTNPSTGATLQAADFPNGLTYELVLTEFQYIYPGSVKVRPEAVVYRKAFNLKRPYLNEDDIFQTYAEGLPHDVGTDQLAAMYKVYLVPSTQQNGTIDDWKKYNIAVLSSYFEAVDTPSVKVLSPVKDALRTNAELVFEWVCNVQVPTFELQVKKVQDATGAAIDPAPVVYAQEIRGITPCDTESGVGTKEQFRFRYTLPRGVGDLTADGTTVFGDGFYAYTLTLKPYNGAEIPLEGSFKVQLTDSGDLTMRECPEAEKDTTWNTQDSFYVRARVRYTGVLKDEADFGGRRIRVEAHYSGSFNGDPVASNSDILVHDALAADGSYDDASSEANRRNRTIRMVKDRVSSDGGFWETRFDVELRGLPTAEAVYLVAYLDLNENGKRDAWEPWGYLMQGLKSANGFYFDPMSVTPVNNGTDYLADFYIQDVDTNNNKLADSGEWLAAGQPSGGGIFGPDPVDPEPGEPGSPDQPGPDYPTPPEGEDWFGFNNGGSGITDEQVSNGGQWFLDQGLVEVPEKHSDGDRMPDWWEKFYGLDAADATGSNGPHGDADGDFLTNYAEYLAKSSPKKYSTAGNGVPDFHIPIWLKRGAPTFGLLYTDNDFMEDHWEAANRSERLNVDTYDAQGDADGDGWSNWAEARANFRTGSHSTNPNLVTSKTQDGVTVLEMPTPVLRLTVDYFGAQDVYTNATEEAKIIVHAYTAKNNNSAPDATFKLPLATSTASAGESTEMTYALGAWKQGVYSGHLPMGNVCERSVKMVYTYVPASAAETTSGSSFTIYDKPQANSDVGELWCDQEVPLFLDGKVSTYPSSQKVGWVNYSSGAYSLDFSDGGFWSEAVYAATSAEGTAGTSGYAFYERTDYEGVATYAYAIDPGQSNTFTLVKPDSGHLREGLNNFFVFADLNGNGEWNDGEPAGVPDQHDVDIGFDQVNKPLHVALTTQAPPGAVRLDVKSILGVLITENDTNDAVTGDNSSIENPSTGKPLNPSLFSTGLPYTLVLTSYKNIGVGTDTGSVGTEVYRMLYNTKKPYITEDEIFGYNKRGLPGTEAINQDMTTYKVYFLPSNVLSGSSAAWINYNIAIVENRFDPLEPTCTKMVSPIGGSVRTNTELTFEWLCNVQVPTFTLKITKVEDAAGGEVRQVVYEEQVRGVTAYGKGLGVGGENAREQFTYRYTLPHGIGELNNAGDALFGNGLYSYTLSLEPYNGSAYVLSGDFRVQMADSGDRELREDDRMGTDTSYNVQDSYHLTAKIHYTGVLTTGGFDGDFGGRRIRIEAHYSGSFNGDPVAANSDILSYDKLSSFGDYDDGTDDAPVAKNRLNRTIRMYKDCVSTDGSMTYSASTGLDWTAKFFRTTFLAELRGLPTADPVYLVAYFDLNGNGKRDAWEPWGYATQGLEAAGGFYFDPKPITPTNSGFPEPVTFYIQDVDTDNDKLADSWEWVSSGKPTTDFDTWCGNYTGSVANHRETDIWRTITDENGVSRLALTAAGAQLYGLTATGTPDENGAVTIAGLEGVDLTEAKELTELVDSSLAFGLAQEGYATYGLTVTNVALAGEEVILSWDVTAARSVDDGALYNLSEAFAKNAHTSAVYAVYGKATLGDAKWTQIGQIEVANLTEPSVELPAENLQLENGTAAFFRIILSTKTSAVETLE